MLYFNVSDFHLAVNRIVPLPKKAEPLEGKPFLPDGKATVTAPTAEFGPVMTANKRVNALFPETGSKTVTLSIEKAPFEARCADEGYCLTVTENAIDIVGYGERGLLYGVITLQQLCKDADAIPAMRVTDWPDNPTRGFKEESRFGPDQMEKEDWLAMIEDMANRKLNTVVISLYGCWGVQYDGVCSEYLFLPLKRHPSLATPKKVKYFSPTENKWIESEDLPPIYRDNFLEDIFRLARDLGIQIVPLWNAFGHNTFLPRNIPEVAAVDENGVSQKNSFCTSNPATYELLFSIFDQIIDDYLIPYGMTSFNIGLDEVTGGLAKDPDDVFRRCEAWCQCPACRSQEKGDLFINHTIKLVSHLKAKGMKSVYIACDMLDPKRAGGKQLGDVTEKLLSAVHAADVADTLVISWWAYHSIPEKMQVRDLYPERGLRNIVAPWNGYQMWCVALQPLGNIQLIGATNHRDGGEGMVAYSIWDRSQDRVHDALAEYSWNYEAAGHPNDVTRRYALRHFPTATHEAYRGYRLMDYAVEQRPSQKWSFPDAEHISMLDLLFYRLNHYIFAYPKADAPYPRVFLDETLEWALPMREDIERALYNGSAVAREAMRIFLSLAERAGCDQHMALRQAYECHNYLTLMEDWLSIFEMHDLLAKGDNLTVAAIARARVWERIDLMRRCEDTKEQFVVKAMTMRQHSIFLQLFEDIAAWCEKHPKEKLELTNMRHVLSDRSWWLR
ncbi:MAG: family 20 glycosylhydrolase [Oscillospiraceae bacterium]|nr:family 20 glycosylhydrolase [Oscillospiraceae bacterium]